MVIQNYAPPTRMQPKMSVGCLGMGEIIKV